MYLCFKMCNKFWQRNMICYYLFNRESIIINKREYFTKYNKKVTSENVSVKNALKDKKMLIESFKI